MREVRFPTTITRVRLCCPCTRRGDKPAPHRCEPPASSPRTQRRLTPPPVGVFASDDFRSGSANKVFQDILADPDKPRIVIILPNDLKTYFQVKEGKKLVKHPWMSGKESMQGTGEFEDGLWKMGCAVLVMDEARCAPALNFSVHKSRLAWSPVGRLSA